MNTDERLALTHQALGEFIIIFQWIENLYRQIGWFILDPDRANWPPMQLRTETNYQLINRVTDMFVGLMQTYAFAKGDEAAMEMIELKEAFHDLRKYRNRLLHSTYVELNSGGEVHGYVRSNPEIGVDSETGELIVDQEDFTAKIIYAKIKEYENPITRLNILRLQLIHWAPFDRHGER